MANALTHGTGLALSLLGLPILVLVAAQRGDVRQVVACSIFATTLVLLYAASTAYHLATGERAKRLLRVADHVAIYLLIAGTYTPFVFGLLRGVLSWTLLGVVWGIAVFGILYKTLLGFRFPRLSTALYVGMGWLAVVAIPPLARAMPPAGLAWLIAGGVCYTGGVIFYVGGHRPYRHAVWHLFVLAGSACHFAAVLGYATGGAR